jgi:hypothetical protein
MVIFIVINFILIFLVIILAKKYLESEKRAAQLSARDSTEIDLTREKKEVKKEAIANWRKENKDTRRHFEKKRKERKDKGKRREAPSQNGEGKKRGKPKGSNGGAWRRPPEDQIDEVVHVHLEKCPECGAGSDQLGEAGGTWEHIMLDLVIKKHNRQLVITKYIIHRYRCKKCGEIVAMDFGALKDCHFGHGFIATVMQSRIESKQSYSKILIELARWIPFFYFFPTGTAIVDWFKKYGDQLEEFYLKCVEMLKEAGHVHADETGLPMNGKNWWLWVITTTIFTLFIPHASRGHDAIEEFFDKFEGVLISDFWGAYNNLTEEQQKCLAHMVKDLKKLFMKSEDTIKKSNKRLKDDTKQKKREEEEKDNKRGRGRPRKEPEPLAEEEREKLKEKIRHEEQKKKHARMFYEFFKRAWGDENEPLSYKAGADIRATEVEAIEQLRVLIEEIEADCDLDPDIKRLIKRMRKYEDHLFTYLSHPGIPPDNNLAERELRPFVIMRKTSFDFKSEEVMDSFALYLSFQRTCKKNGVHFGEALRQVLSGEITPVLKALTA